jgi:hypothetical protein
MTGNRLQIKSSKIFLCAAIKNILRAMARRFQKLHIFFWTNAAYVMICRAAI